MLIIVLQRVKHYCPPRQEIWEINEYIVWYKSYTIYTNFVSVCWLHVKNVVLSVEYKYLLNANSLGCL
jgi:hypothetical protein